MSDKELERVKTDLHTVKRAAGLDLERSRGGVWEDLGMVVFGGFCIAGDVLFVRLPHMKFHAQCACVCNPSVTSGDRSIRCSHK